MAATPSCTRYTRAAWASAQAKRHACFAVTLSSDDRLNESARLLDRAYRRLNQSGKRLMG
jgi:hypothetical protein